MFSEQVIHRAAFSCECNILIYHATQIMRSFEYSYPHMNAWVGDQSGGMGIGWLVGWGVGGGCSNLGPPVAGSLGRFAISHLGLKYELSGSCNERTDVCCWRRRKSSSFIEISKFLEGGYMNY
jgi:hypothetical protein